MVTLDQGGFARADTAIAAAPADLADVIEHAFVRHDGAAPQPTGRWRIVPDPSAHLVVVVARTPRGRVLRAALVGARSTYTDIDVADRELTLGLRLRPGALAALARVDAAALTDRGVALESVFGAAWRDVADPVGDGDTRAAVTAMFALVRAGLRGGRPDGALIAEALRARSVEAMADHLGMPVRTLYKRTQAAIGLPPKRLLRILRMYRVLDGLGPSADWARRAAIAGFADQPHLVRETRALLGESPGAWMARGAGGARRADSFKTAHGTVR